MDSPKGLVASSDGNIWFTLFGANKISKVTPAGVFTEYTLPSPSSGPYQIASGSDGALWFTEFQNSAKQVGKITTAGAITEYSIPDAAGTTPRALGIASGSDGALWVTCPNTSQIARVSTAGQVTTYTLPSSYSPSAITSGPDGALWFVENGTLGAVGRISTDGVVTHYPLPSSVAGTLTAITNGPDGALWFIDSLTQGPKIGRITTKGETTFFDAPGAFSSLVAGPDGALWYVSGGLTVGRMTTSGSVTTFNCNGQVIASSSSGACFPDQAARGPNGTIWFTDLKRGYIVQGTVGGLTVTNLSPTSAAEGATTDLKLTVNGTGFAAGAGVWWNGRQLLTDFVNGGQLIATVPSSSLVAGTVTIYVVNPGQGTSNTVTFTVTTTTTAALAVTTSSNLPLGVIGSSYSQPLGATGGAPPYKWSVASGSLPAGLSLAANGTLSGVPTSVGTSSFTVNLADSGSNSLSQSFNVTVFPAVAFTTSALRIPQVADGAGWNTRFALVNLDSSAVTYTFQFWNDAGQALALPILGGSPGVATGSIAPGGIAFVQSAGSSPTLLQGWAEVASTGRIGVTALYQFVASGTRAIESSAVGAPSSSSVFVPFDNTGGHTTAVGVANANATQSLTITVQLQTEAGARTVASLTLPPRGHTAFIVPAVYPAVANTRGVINFTASSPDISVMGLWQGPSAIGGSTFLGAFQ